MGSRMLIRKKILFLTLLLTGTLLLWMYCSLQGVYAYRNLSLMVSQLAAELKTSSKLRSELDKLMSFADSPRRQELGEAWLPQLSVPPRHAWFREQLREVETTLNAYEAQVRNHMLSDPLLSDRGSELQRVTEIRAKLDAVRWISDDVQPDFISASSKWLEDDLESLAVKVQDLPSFLLERMENFRGEVRSRYRALIVIISLSSVVALVIVGTSFWFFRRSVVQPFKLLLSGSRLIAQGKFDHRIHVRSQDELAELADALNTMTGRFLSIRNNLNETVQQRTREVVRSEQLASVGFLAAGVAHEINNPLASIAWSAEALESRLHEILHCTATTACEPIQPSLPQPEISDGSPNQPTSVSGLIPSENAATQTTPGYDPDQIEVLRKYLKRIQDEAFRCKGITERLLDFSRLGESQRKQPTDIHQSITDVIELVKHLGQYRNKSLQFRGQPQLMAWVSPTEFKQVVLNLLTNSLDACQPGGLVQIELASDSHSMILTVHDNGCGMTEEVLQHLFEPFFTRRRDGRGTGLGLSITYRIVQDHGGELVPSSPGPNQGATFILRLPLQSSGKGSHEGLEYAA